MDSTDLDKTVEVNIFNEAAFREEFALEVGHTPKCVGRTIDFMLKVMGNIACDHGLPQDVVNNPRFSDIDYVKFDTCLRKILEDKDCKCKANKAMDELVKQGQELDMGYDKEKD